MLQNLSIKDFILIKKLDLDFNKGFSVITGETGAGKSILLDTIVFCFGNRFSSDIIRKGADYCLVTLVFKVNEEIKTYLTEKGIEFEDNLVIKRFLGLNSKKNF